MSIVREFRKKHGLSQKELSELLDYSWSHIRHLDQGTINISEHVIEKIRSITDEEIKSIKKNRNDNRNRGRF